MEFLQPEAPYVLFRDRPEWSDVQPIPQDDGLSPLAPIMYNDKYKDATSYFRAIYVAREHSARVLDLTLEIIKQNASHYTVWQYRYRTLLALKAPLTGELHLLSRLLPTHLKSYQAWNHRRLLLLQLGKRAARSELAFAEVALQKDAKNYHTWVYREWLLCNFFAPRTASAVGPSGDGEEAVIEEVGDGDAQADDGVWAEELVFTERMLDEDVRNNSVWHHRFFVLFEGPKARSSPEVVEGEVEFTKRKIALAPNNASAWNYLRGVLAHSKTPLSTLLPFAHPYTLPQSAQSALRATLPPTPTGADDERQFLPGEHAELPCAQAVEFVADALGERAGAGDGEAARSLYDVLVERDPIRKQFWEYRKRSLQAEGKGPGAAAVASEA